MNNKNPFFSIIIPTRNRPKLLKNCLQSITSIDYPQEDFEVIIVDDGSDISPEAITDRFKGELNIMLILQTHAGPAAARNTGAEKAKGVILVFTDDDCEFRHDWLKTMAFRFSLTPNCIIGGRVSNALPDNMYSTANHLLIDYLYKYYNDENTRFLTSNNLAVPSLCFYEVGGFDKQFPSAAAEDREFCDRILYHGYKMIYAPEVINYHAHEHTLCTFLRLHFRYGRGALQFHNLRSQRNEGNIKLESPLFYVDLIRYPLLKARGLRVVLISMLMIISQIANAAGFLFEGVRIVIKSNKQKIRLKFKQLIYNRLK